MSLTIKIDLDKKCVECGNGGAVDSGICLGCTSKALAGKPMKSPAGRMVAMRFRDMKKSRKRT